MPDEQQNNPLPPKSAESPAQASSQTPAAAQDPPAKAKQQTEAERRAAGPPVGEIDPVTGKRKKIRGQGRVMSVQGPVVDVFFDDLDDIPALYDVIEVWNFNKRRIVLQTAEHLNKNVVRTVSLMETLDLQLNAPCFNTFRPIAVPVGDKCFGRIMDAVGNPIDEKGPIDEEPRPIRQLTQA
ncbi:MAG TPA: hypothetical protein VLJ10_03485, partial [Candidatus Bathyarchaeia archaeon]|nr:hypothetical protein [Candidatus Bathyarchaeia archaeon]